MTQRIGLRHISRVIPPHLICPSGEQIVNGGFESDFTGWTTIYAGAQIDTTTKHSGAKSVYFPAASGAAIYQLFAQAVPQVCIDIFEVYFKAEIGYPAWGAMAYILYQGWSVSDPYNSDYTSYQPVYPPTSGFKQHNLKAKLEPAKGDVVGIILQGIGAPESWADDASLIGTG